MRVLFVGAHADDIEIGCGGTLLKLAAEGHDVSAIVLTQDPGARELRCHEFAEAMSIAGVMPDRVHVWDANDGDLRADGAAVGAFRDFLKARAIAPDVVFCHTQDDSHGDHRRANDLCRAAFRKVTLLLYDVVNSGVTTDFQPDLWVDVTPYVVGKMQMLEVYASQVAKGRILWQAIEALHRRHAERVRGDAAEAFQTMILEGDDDGAALLFALNDCTFTRIWRRLIDFDRASEEAVLTIIYGRSVGGVVTARDGDSFNHDIASLCGMQQRLLRHFPGSAKFHGLSLRSEEASAYGDDRHLRQGDVLIIGGPAVNNAALRFFDHVPGLRYSIAYDIPNYVNLRIVDRLSGEERVAAYRVHDDGARTVERDLAIVSILKNPYRPGSLIVGAMGIHGYGTEAAMRLLSGEGCDLSLLFAGLHALGADNVAGAQFLIETVDGRSSLPIEGSLHLIQSKAEPVQVVAAPHTGLFAEPNADRGLATIARL